MRYARTHKLQLSGTTVITYTVSMINALVMSLIAYARRLMLVHMSMLTSRTSLNFFVLLFVLARICVYVTSEDQA